MIEYEGSIEEHKKYMTADGLDSRTLRTLYLVNKFEDKIEDFSVGKEVRVTHSFGNIAKRDGTDFDPFNKFLKAEDFFGSLSSAQKAFEAHLRFIIKSAEDESARAATRKAEAERKLENLLQETAPYLKPTSDKKTEKLGKIRF